MKRGILILIAMLFLVNFASANVIITEIMYAPTQTASDTDGEWIEIYNTGEESVDLTDWNLDGYNFDDIIIQPNEYIVIARELLDGDDEDLESFESVWGNNNGVWDENFNAIDGYFALSDSEDTIVLTNDIYTETINYNSGLGANRNGKSLARLNYSETIFEEKDPTPGAGLLPEGDVEIVVDIENIVPIIQNITILTDDSPEEGIQILPEMDQEKFFNISVKVSDNNGFEDIQNVKAIIQERTYNLTFVSNLSETEVFFQGQAAMLPTDEAKDYNLTIQAIDYNLSDVKKTSFTYLGFISTTINTSSLNFNNLEPGSLSNEEYLIIENTGNIAVQTLLSGSDLISDEGNIPVNNVEFLSNEQWSSLSKTTQQVCSLTPGIQEQIPLRITVPSVLPSGTYVGALQVTSMEL